MNRRTFCAVLLLVAAALALFGAWAVWSRRERSKIVAGKQVAGALEREIAKTVSCKYLLFLPKDYSERERWPLVLFLHGAGERGDDLELVKKHGIPKLAEKREDFRFIALSPQCPLDVWWDTDVLIALLDEIIAQHSVDEDRVYVTGLSMGGFGAWKLATEHPDRFAAIAPICGGGTPRLADRMRHIPAWVFHGAKDPVVPLKKSEEMVEALKACGGDVRFTVYPEAEHDSWTETYDNSELYRWLLSHKRQSR
jgi:predicted peptidase